MRWRICYFPSVLQLFFLAIFVALPLIPFPQADAAPLDANTIIKRVEDNLNGKTAMMRFSMQVKTSRSLRTIKMTSYAVGKQKSFIRIDYPGRDKGITFLKINNAMWQYVPRIEKIFKIPASMMLQSWMGSDFTNDDLVKESSLSRDYTTRLQAETTNQYTLQLLPQADAAVVWEEIIMTVSRKYFLPMAVKYYDEDRKLVRVIRYLNVKKIGTRFYPTHWLVIPQGTEKSGHQTIIDITEAVFDKPIDNNYFRKTALRRFSN